jgi:hypothetical protein
MGGEGRRFAGAGAGRPAGRLAQRLVTPVSAKAPGVRLCDVSVRRLRAVECARGGDPARAGGMRVTANCAPDACGDARPHRGAISACLRSAHVLAPHKPTVITD